MVATALIWESLIDSLCSANALDRRFSLRVEDVKSGRAHGNAQRVAYLDPDVRLDACHHDILADLHVEQDFRAELLDHLYHSVKARVVEIDGARHSEVLRAHAKGIIPFGSRTYAGRDVALSRLRVVFETFP